MKSFDTFPRLFLLIILIAIPVRLLFHVIERPGRGAGFSLFWDVFVGSVLFALLLTPFELYVVRPLRQRISKRMKSRPAE
jgi:hypothetical protein